MRRLLILSSAVLILFFNVGNVFAESSYVLPYPSAMPGSIWYKIDLVKEKLSQIFSFGDFSQFDFNLAESDKYLVEAKTLFEYKQYLLGYQALIKSDNYFRKTLPNLASAKRNGKNISEKEKILKNAAFRHEEVLAQLLSQVPPVFNWTPEKKPPTNLELKQAIANSIKITKLYE